MCVKAVAFFVFFMVSAGVVFAQATREHDGAWLHANSDTAGTPFRGAQSGRMSLPEGARTVSFTEMEVESSGRTDHVYTGTAGALQIRFVSAGGSYFHGVQPDTTLPFAFKNSYYPNPSSKQTPPFALLTEASFAVQVLTPEHVELGKFELNGINAGPYWIEPSESGRYVFQIWYHGEAVYRPIRIVCVR
ncbi:MAG: hypothetical protein GY780_02050 [bacterium]|nr:hypothetical protein [bacterium]